MIGSRKYCSQECYHKFYKHKPSCGNKPSSYEIKVINLRIKDLEFVGDHKFWITFENGKNKCPDFVLRPFSKTHTVIEVWGRYWHDKNGDDYRLVQEEYKKLDYNVLFLFDEDFKKDEKYIKRVVKYVDENKKN